MVKFDFELKRNSARLVGRRRSKCYYCVALRRAQCAGFDGRCRGRRRKSEPSKHIATRVILGYQEMVANSGICFGMLDSSPQGGRNWLMCEYTHVRGEAIQAASEAFAELVQFTRSSGVETNLDVAEKMKLLHDVVESSLERHILPPTGVGARHSSAGHKAHCWFTRIGLRAWTGIWPKHW